jgi:hypothetical protein
MVGLDEIAKDVGFEDDSGHPYLNLIETNMYKFKLIRDVPDPLHESPVQQMYDILVFNDPGSSYHAKIFRLSGEELQEALLDRKKIHIDYRKPVREQLKVTEYFGLLAQQERKTGLKYLSQLLKKESAKPF